jgi:pimeloyl-ACP methyl ester carboxylesterase
MRKIKFTLIALVLSIAAFSIASDVYRYDFYRIAIDFEASQANFSAQHINIDNKPYAYLENTQDNKLATIIMLHGFSASKENWLRYSVPFAEDYHLIALDLMGHGENDAALSQSYTIEEQVKFVAKFTKALGLSKFHLVGNSMGGAISSLYAANYPEQVESITLISPAGVHDIPSRMDELLEEGTNPLIAESIEEFEDLMAFVMEDQPFIPGAITKVEAEKSAQRIAINKKIFKDIRSDLGKGLEVRFKDIKAPALIIWGEEDRAINVKNIDKYAQLIPNAQKLTLPGIGHLAMLEAPKVSAQATLAFIPKI